MPSAVAPVATAPSRPPPGAGGPTQLALPLTLPAAGLLHTGVWERDVPMSDEKNNSSVATHSGKLDRDVGHGNVALPKRAVHNAFSRVDGSLDAGNSDNVFVTSVAGLGGVGDHSCDNGALARRARRRHPGGEKGSGSTEL